MTEPVLQLRPVSQLWQCQMLNLLHYKGTTRMMHFVEHFLCARHAVESFTWIILFNLHIKPMTEAYFAPKNMQEAMRVKFHSRFPEEIKSIDPSQGR